MRALEQRYDGKVKIVRINVDSSEARPYLTKYRVRGTPSFALLDRHGRVLSNWGSWPGEQQVAKAFDTAAAQP